MNQVDPADLVHGDTGGVVAVARAEPASDGGPPASDATADARPERQRSTQDGGEDRRAAFAVSQFDVVHLADGLAIDVEDLAIQQQLRHGEVVLGLHVIDLPSLGRARGSWRSMVPP
jgi:hypothetical protein